MEHNEVIAGQELIAIGKVQAPRGTKGEVRVVPLTDFPERLLPLKSVLIGKGAGGKNFRRIEVEEVRFHGKSALIRFRGIDTISDAEPLRGCLLYVTAGEAVSLPEGRYFIHDIVGLRVLNQAGEELGTVEEVIRTRANDVYVVRRPGMSPARRELLIPAVRHVVKRVDLRERLMVVELLPGMDS